MTGRKAPFILSLLLCFFLILFFGLRHIHYYYYSLTEKPKEIDTDVAPIIPGNNRKTDRAQLYFSHDSGTYSESELTVSISAPQGYTIAYTVDGTVPFKDDDTGLSEVEIIVGRTEQGYLCAHRDLMLIPELKQTGFFENSSLPSGTVLTASLIDDEGNLSKPVTKVYYLGIDFEELYPDCMIVSVITDPNNLLDYETGFLASGAVYDKWKETSEAKEIIKEQKWWEIETNSTQRGRKWERPVLFQLYDSGNRPAIECNAGLRVRGGISRVTVQKAFNLYFRGSYGNSRLEYELFPGTFSYKSITLKTGGNTLDGLKYKDLLLHDLVKDRNFMTLNARPAVLFINGEYWGPYLLQEKISAYQLGNRFGVEADQIVVIKDAAVEVGEESDIEMYEELMSYSERDLADPDTYREFCSKMDINSMADYFAARIYIGDADWKQVKNDVLWRTKDASCNKGRWQYILYDTDYSSGT